MTDLTHTGPDLGGGRLYSCIVLLTSANFFITHTIVLPELSLVKPNHSPSRALQQQALRKYFNCMKFLHTVKKKKAVGKNAILKQHYVKHTIARECPHKSLIPCFHHAFEMSI